MDFRIETGNFAPLSWFIEYPLVRGTGRDFVRCQVCALKRIDARKVVEDWRLTAFLPGHVHRYIAL